MKRKLTLFLLIMLCISCSSKDDSNDNNIINPNSDLIFNEPLILFGKTKQEVMNAEKREILSKSPLTYKESKNNLEYTLIYGFDNNKMIEVHVFIPNKSGILMYDETVKSLSSKYKKDSNKDMFRADSYVIYPYPRTTETEWIYIPR